MRYRFSLKENMGSTPDVLQQFISDLAANQRNTYSHAAALTFCLYDIILSFSQEVEYVWMSKRSLVTALYLIVRYYGVINLIGIVAMFTQASSNLDVKECQRYFFWTITGVPIVFVLALDAILLLRLYALYNRSKKVLITLLVLISINFGVALWVYITVAKNHAAHIWTRPSPWSGCITNCPGLKFTLSGYIFNCILSLVFLSMTIWKLVENHQTVHGKLTWGSLREMREMPPLLLAFVRDGSVFFALTAIINFLRLTIWFTGHAPVKPAFFPWTVAFDSYAGSHLILGLRAAGKGKTNPSWNETMSFKFLPSSEGSHGSRASDGIRLVSK